MWKVVSKVNGKQMHIWICDMYDNNIVQMDNISLDLTLAIVEAHNKAIRADRCE